MTQLRFNAKPGCQKTDVTAVAGSGIGTDACRLLVDDANIRNKQQLLTAIEAIKQKIIEYKFPMA